MRIDNPNEWSVWMGGDQVLPVVCVEVGDGVTVITLQGESDAPSKSWGTGASERAVFSYGSKLRRQVDETLKSLPQELSQRVRELEIAIAQRDIVISTLRGETGDLT